MYVAVGMANRIAPAPCLANTSPMDLLREYRHKRPQHQALLAIQNWEPPYLKTTHAVCRRLRSRVFKNVLDARRHNFADRATVRWISLRGCAKRNIHVG